MKKRKKSVIANNKDFEHYRPWVKGMVFGSFIGFSLVIIQVLLYLVNSDFDSTFFIILTPIISMAIGAIIGLILFRKYNKY